MRCWSRRHARSSPSAASARRSTTSPSAAGVGTGTAYRHFRNKQEIAAEVLRRRDPADRHRRRGRVGDQGSVAGDRHVLRDDGRAPSRGPRALPNPRRPGERRRQDPHLAADRELPSTKLFTRAKKAKAIRADARPEDAALIFAMLGVVFDMGSAAAPDLWRRYLTLCSTGCGQPIGPSCPSPRRSSTRSTTWSRWGSAAAGELTRATRPVRPGGRARAERPARCRRGGATARRRSASSGSRRGRRSGTPVRPARRR